MRKRRNEGNKGRGLEEGQRGQLSRRGHLDATGVTPRIRFSCWTKYSTCQPFEPLHCVCVFIIIFFFFLFKEELHTILVIPIFCIIMCIHWTHLFNLFYVFFCIYLFIH